MKILDLIESTASEGRRFLYLYSPGDSLATMITRSRALASVGYSSAIGENGIMVVTKCKSIYQKELLF